METAKGSLRGLLAGGATGGADSLALGALAESGLRL